MRKFVLLAALMLLALMTVGAGQAFAATRWVNDDGVATPPGSSCTKPGYNTIQSAVNAAGSGDLINVCPGTYPEQVVVEMAAKSNIVLRSTTPLAARIQAPPVMEAVHGDLVRIDQGARNVALLGFTVAGPLPDTLFCSVALRSGVRVKGNATALIAGNYITEIRSANPALRGCQNGFAIAVGRQFDVPVPNQVGQAAIAGNRIDTYQKGGIYVDGAGSRALLDSNTVRGIGSTPVIAQNGIQISRNALVQASRNTVSDNTYGLPLASSASGFIIFEAHPDTVIERNLVQRNDDNIVVFTQTGIEISNNRVLNSTFYDGIFMADDTSNNRIEDNYLRGNTEHDCHDSSVGTRTAGTANYWKDNDGVTENRPGLCTKDNDDDDDDDDDDDHRKHRHGHGHDD